MKKFFKNFLVLATALSLILVFAGCSKSKEKVLIYTSMEDYRIDYLNKRLLEEFPKYDVSVVYMGTGNIAAKLMAEGKDTDCDIVASMECAYLKQIGDAGFLTDLSDYDFSIYCDDVCASKFCVPELRNGGAIIINPAVIEKRGLEIPTSYDDLLKSEYKGLISMPNPASSGTGYMFLLAMVNSRGEDAAFSYFDAFAQNVLQFTSSGSGPVNALIQGEVAVGLGMTAQAVTMINDGTPLEIIFFDEGSPFSLYGNAISVGKAERKAVKEVFDFLNKTYNYENCEKFFPEQIYKDKTFTVKNYPQNIHYCDMSDDTAERKEHLLSLWKY